MEICLEGRIQITRSRDIGSYLTTSYNAKAARQRGLSPYKIDEMAFVAYIFSSFDGVRDLLQARDIVSLIETNLHDP